MFTKEEALIKLKEGVQANLKLLENYSQDFKIILKLAPEIRGNLSKDIQTMGILAGFGFTGISGVSSKVIFVLGELLCIIAILLIGALRDKSIVEEFMSNREHLEVQRSAEEYKQINEQAIQEIESNGELSVERKKQIDTITKKIQDYFKEVKETSNAQLWYWRLFILGTVIFLLSFLPINLFQEISKLLSCAASILS
jgi:hypothetical protein